MASSDKITILLADEDALRRDGLAAVLHGTGYLEVVAQCPDGEAAMIQIRDLLPDVAVVDLNIPKLHGIELVRRVRSESLATKIVILSGSQDDDIVREVVRAGCDAYLLKNGPARHLIDAISYVRDGGQYFSPQLRRAGLDRHLLEETPRPLSEAAPPPAKTGGMEKKVPRADAADESREGRTASARRASNTRSSDPQRLRQRLQEDAPSGNLEDRDYEILTMMAEGIRPILERLDEIEGRVGEMETGEAPVPSNVVGWLDNQIADTFRDSRPTGKDVISPRSLRELETRLPQMIEEAVTSRFHNMASKLQQEVEETHVRTLETFVKNIQVKLVQRVSALETDMSKQAEAMNQLREYSLRTEDNLSRLITGVDKLAQELPKRLAAPEPLELPAPSLKPLRRRSSSRWLSPKTFWIAMAAILVIAIAASQLPKLWKNGESADSPPATAAASAPAPIDAPPITAKPIPPPPNADTGTKLKAAEEYTERKDYAMAEDIYRQVVKAEPNNVGALKSLASVLYREDKIEESAAILDKIPRTN